MIIKVDNREGDYIRKLKKEIPDIIEEQLPIGDIVVEEKSLVIERKECGDFWNSLTGGRLFEQAANMMNSFTNRYIVIIGDFGSLYFSGIKHTNVNAFLGAQASLAAKYGINVITVKNGGQYVKMVQYIIEKTGECVIDAPIKRLNYSSNDRAIAMLTAFDGISKKKSERLIAHFGSLSALFQASPEEIEKIDGFGNKSSQKLYEDIISIVYGGKKGVE